MRLFLATLLVLLGAATPAAAATGACTPGGPRCTFWSGKVTFVADGDTIDRVNVDGEWVEISNGSAAPLALGGWWFRDSALRRYVFPAAAVVPAGGRVTLRMGRGADGGDTFHWGLPTPPFENPSYDERATGDGGYLFDPRGNLRAWSIYN